MSAPKAVVLGQVTLPSGFLISGLAVRVRNPSRLEDLLVSNRPRRPISCIGDLTAATELVDGVFAALPCWSVNQVSARFGYCSLPPAAA